MFDEEKILIENICGSDSYSFKTLFYNLHDEILCFVLYRVQDSDIAKDIT